MHPIEYTTSINQQSYSPWFVAFITSTWSFGIPCCYIYCSRCRWTRRSTSEGNRSIGIVKGGRDDKASCRNRNSKPRHPRKRKLLPSLPDTFRHNKSKGWQTRLSSVNRWVWTWCIASTIGIICTCFFRKGFPSAWPGVRNAIGIIERISNVSLDLDRSRYFITWSSFCFLSLWSSQPLVSSPFVEPTFRFPSYGSYNRRDVHSVPRGVEKSCECLFAGLST